MIDWTTAGIIAFALLDAGAIIAVFLFMPPKPPRKAKGEDLNDLTGDMRRKQERL